MSDQRCYHCDLPVPPGVSYPVFVKGEQRQMCCPGCQAVATAIVDGGLERFYDYRSSSSQTPEAHSVDRLSHYDLPEVQADFVHLHPDGSASVELFVSGITCSACAWLIEHHLSSLDGVVSASVNISSHRCRLQWRPETLKLSALLAAFDAIGYEARPAGDVDAEQQRSKENKTALLRLGLAGLGMMQAGMVAIALYAGDYQGIEPEWQQLLRWVSLLIVTPVVLYSARPFYSAALRSLKVKRLVMDVPVSIAIILAFSASIWGTITNSGEVYFDSVSMFTFFLLLGRYLEMRVRHRNDADAGGLSRLIPPVASKLVDGLEQYVPVKSLQSGDIVLVREGETLPCDGDIVRGSSELIEAILTGEQQPVTRLVGDAVSAGTLNVDNPLEVRVSAIGQGTRLAAILQMVDEAQAVKPRRAAMVDKLAGWFVARLLVISVCVYLAWLYIDPSRALWVTLSVLVVTCPCALSLATPAALTVTTGELRKRGFLIRKAHVLESLGALDHCIFDKTGTLTLGRMRIAGVEPEPGVSDGELLTLAAALERGSTHPIARAFKTVSGPLPPVDNHQVIVGQGVCGAINGKPYAFGKAALIQERFQLAVDIPATNAGVWLVLANDAKCLGRIYLHDELRPGAEDAVRQLSRQGIAVELLSGDRQSAAANVAAVLGIGRCQGEASPEAKLARVKELQQQNHHVLMVGDGINDVPVLSAAEVSVAMGDAADLTRLHADALLVSGNLTVLAEAIALARKTTTIIRQNLAWALGYNLLALPLAVMGYVPPWAAAIGMSASSLVVIANALRLSRSGRRAIIQPEER